MARASGGVTFYTKPRTTSTGATLRADSGSWSSLSDRHAKTAIEPVRLGRVLGKLRSLPVRSWQYKSQQAGVRHMGPMAQAFHRAFGLGESRRYISDVDAQGVALAGIKALAERAAAHGRQDRAQARKIAAQRRQLRSQGKRIAALERQVKRLAKR